MEEDYWIPRTLDAPALFFIWEADSAMIVIVVVLLGALMNMFIFGMVAAYFTAKGYQYMKEEGGRGLILKTLYWVTPSDLWLTPLYQSWVREYLGE